MFFGRYRLGAVALLVLVCARPGSGQAPPQRSLDAAVSQVRDGALFDALLTLNDLVAALTGQPESAATLARVHAYRAFIYLRQEQPERARLAVIAALSAEPGIAVAATEFGAALVTLFMQARDNPQVFAAAANARTAPRPVPTPVPAPAVTAKTDQAALIYIYWPKQLRSFGREKVLCDQRHVADLGNGRFVAVTTAPGTHHLSFRGRDVTAIVDGGREYHYRASIEGYMRFDSRPLIQLVSADIAVAEMREKASPNDPKRTFSTDCTAPAATSGKRRE